MLRRLIRRMAKCDNNSDDLGKAKAMEAEEAVFQQAEEIARSEAPFIKRIDRLKARVSDTKAHLGKGVRNAEGDNGHLRPQG